MNWCLLVRCQLFVGNLEGKASSIRSKLQNADMKTASIISLVGSCPQRNVLCHSDFFTFSCDCAEFDSLFTYTFFVFSVSAAQLNSNQPVNYNILLDPESDRAMTRHAGRDLHLTVSRLEPFTTYHIRVQACQRGDVLCYFLRQ